MAIMGDKMNGLHFKPSLGDCRNEKFGYLELAELAEISNSPSLRKGNLKHQKKRGLASFNQETRGKNMNQIAAQPSITEVKRLHIAKTQIFNNWGEMEI